MYFTLGISAAAAPRCAALTRAALDTDPRVLPIPGSASVVWRSADGRAAVVRWGGPAGPPVPGVPSCGGTLWADPVAGILHARTAIARTDPVYVAELPGALLLSDRASWAAAVAGRLGDLDPVMLAAFLNLGYPLGTATPFRGVRALGNAQSLRAAAGQARLRRAVRDGGSIPETGAVPETSAVPAAGAAAVGAALVHAVSPLAESAGPVELSLTGGKDSRLIAAALAVAKVPFRARTHGAADHPDVVVAGLIAGRLGIEHIVTGPRPPGTADPADVLARLRSGVLVSDGMLSAYENLGRPDPAFAADPVQAGGHGGELLRGGYATYAGGAARGAVQFRRLTTRRLRLLHPGAATGYLSSLAPWVVRFGRAPLRALDDFYLINRAGRWSAAARQAYLLRSPLAQPFFADQVVRTARAVPLRTRVSGQLHRDLMAGLCPGLRDIQLAGRGPAAADWRRCYGEDVAAFLRGYVLDQGPGLFDVVSKRAAERVLRLPHTDHEAVWALATLTALASGDWLNARGRLAAAG